MAVRGTPRPPAVLVVTEQKTTPLFLDDLARSGRFRLAGRVTSLATAGRLAQEHRPEVILVEVATPDRLNALVQAQPLLRSVGVVVLSALPAETVLLLAMSAGVRGFVRKPVDADVLHESLRAVAAGHMFIDPRSTPWLVDLALRGRLARMEDGLTVRQSQVVSLVRAGLTNRQIAQALEVSTDTVKTHLQDAMRKLGVRDRRSAALAVEGNDDPS